MLMLYPYDTVHNAMWTTVGVKPPCVCNHKWLSSKFARCEDTDVPTTGGDQSLGAGVPVHPTTAFEH